MIIRQATLTKFNIVRKAEIKDKTSIIELSIQFYKESLRSYGLAFNFSTLDKLVEEFINNKIVIVSEVNGKVVGVIAGFVSSSMFDSQQKIGQEIIWYIDKEYRKGSIGIRLLKEFEKQCKLNGANLMVMVYMGNLNNELLDRFYKMNNYRLLENQFIKGV